jgi:hypothetical protein
MMCHCTILDASGDGTAAARLEPIVDTDYVAAVGS